MNFKFNCRRLNEHLTFCLFWWRKKEQKVKTCWKRNVKAMTSLILTSFFRVWFILQINYLTICFTKQSWRNEYLIRSAKPQHLRILYGVFFYHHFYTLLTLPLHYVSDEFDTTNTLTSLPVTVIHKERLVDKIFTVSVIVLVSIIFINFGCALDVSLLKESFKKPTGIIIGIICQFIFMPLVSIWLFWLRNN